MKRQQQQAVQINDQCTDAPAAVPADLLQYVSGGLPYHGFGMPEDMTAGSADSTAEPLPYHGF
jgi:hypothetical protein